MAGQKLREAQRSSESLSRAVPTGSWDCTKALETISDKLFTVQIDYRRVRIHELLQAERKNRG